MTLSEIAAGLEVTTEQRDRGVATVDDTGRSLADRLADVGDLPCTSEAAAVLVEAYAGGASVGESAREASVPPVTAAKTLHLLGEDVNPLAPTARRIVRDWLAGDLSRADALALTGADEAEFSLAVYAETHDALPDAQDTLAGALAVDPGDPLAETRSSVDDLYGK